MGATQKRTVLITGYVFTPLDSPMPVTDVEAHNSCSTGGAGHALALEFAARGFRVFATARSTASLTGLEEKGVEIFPLDVTKIESITALKDEITKRTGGKLDILYNNAGTSTSHPLREQMSPPLDIRVLTGSQCIKYQLSKPTRPSSGKCSTPMCLACSIWSRPSPLCSWLP